MPAPTNLSEATAIEIQSLPFSTTQDVHDAGTTYTVWYKYTAKAGEKVLLIRASGAGTYTPEISMYTPNGSTLALLTGFDNAAIQFGLVEGQTYWFECVTNAGNPTPAILTVQAAAGPAQQWAIGDLFVSDDKARGTSAVVRATAGEVINFISTFSSGEDGDVLDGGEVCHNNSDDTVDVYNALLELIATLNFPGATQVPFIRGSRRGNKFYAIESHGAGLAQAVKTVLPAGVFGLTTWTLTSVIASTTVRTISPNRDETILYYAHTGVNAAVRRWNLSTDAAMADLVAGVPNVQTFYIISLDDDTILVVYGVNAGAGVPDCIIRRYDASGTLLNSYNVGTSVPRIATALDDPNSFWLMITPAGGSREFRNVKVSDGSTLSSVSGYVFTDRVADDPTIFEFGTPFSCPLLVLRAGGGAGGSEESPSTKRYFIRRLRRAPILSDENRRMFYSKIELDMRVGIGNANPPGEDPVIWLRWTDDGGMTWSEPIQASVGKRGEYDTEVAWNRLGSGPKRAFEYYMTDPVPWEIYAAYLNGR
jgi:hypothetical protein